jgi:hypothetical protein
VALPFGDPKGTRSRSTLLFRHMLHHSAEETVLINSMG